MKNQKLEISIDFESVSIYREMGEDKDPLHVVYWTEDEWLEDADLVVPAMLQAINLYHINQVLLLKTLGLEAYILFNNNDLSFELEKIQEFDTPLITKAFDDNLDNPFAIDVEDSSYWYPTEKERDEDFETLKLVLSPPTVEQWNS